MALPAFRFKKFEVVQEGAAHPVGTDAVLLGAWADISGAQQFLDIGAGTGVVSLMIAQRLAETCRHWRGCGVEIHASSAALARQNYQACPWAAQLELRECAVQLLDGCPAGHFDLIVSNPPFFSETTQSPDAARSLGRHSATLSPVELLRAVKKWMSPEGRFCVVLPAMEGYRLCELAVPMGLYWTQLVEVYGKADKPLERLLLQFERNPYPVRRDKIVLQEHGQRSEAFRALTKDFYLAD
ncbi:MAG: methyltransferase [Saprospiraceae bacterium]|nr:methyltransferase [Saprospiraceae bacterium]